MWVKEGYEPPRSSPPAEVGKRLATFPRGRGVEFRVSLNEYEGRPYLNLRVWEAGTDGRFWPCKGKGVSVRLSEVAGLIEALGPLAGGGDGPPPRTGAEEPSEYRPKGRGGRPAFDTEKLRPATAPNREFDETRE